MRKRSFTLIELMASVFIFTVASAALFRGFAASIDAMSRIQSDLAGLAFADEALSRVILQCIEGKAVAEIENPSVRVMREKNITENSDELLCRIESVGQSMATYVRLRE